MTKTILGLGGRRVFKPAQEECKRCKAASVGAALDAVFTERVGELVQTPLLFEDFSFGIRPDWTVVDGGEGEGPASTWTTFNPEGRDTRLNTPPFALVDSDGNGQGLLMDEQLITPAVDAGGRSGVSLEFTHEFNWYELGFDEKADVEVRSALAAGAGDVQVRFRYHEARFEWWWGVDTIFLLGDNGFVCRGSRIFGDGFEGGGLGAWSGAVGRSPDDGSSRRGGGVR